MMNANCKSLLGQVVDLSRYPIDEPGSENYKRLLAAILESLKGDGCCVLDGFIRNEQLAQLQRESEAAAPSAYYTTEIVNVYNTPLEPRWHVNHPAAMTFERGNAFVARDQLPPACLIESLYTDHDFQQFIAACFGQARIYQLADPLAGLCINVLKPGKEHPWHFDTNEFTVSLLTRKAESGGAFQYCPNIRKPGEENLTEVKAVLDGKGESMVEELELQCGDLQIFRGRHSLHRVKCVTGKEERHTAIFAYTQKPGVIGSVERTRQLFGRVLDVHEQAQRNRSRSDTLLD